MKLQMEDFYSAEVDADVLLLQRQPLREFDVLFDELEENSLFADFQAVKSGQVYTTGSNFYDSLPKPGVRI